MKFEPESSYKHRLFYADFYCASPLLKFCALKSPSLPWNRMCNVWHLYQTAFEALLPQICDEHEL